MRRLLPLAGLLLAACAGSGKPAEDLRLPAGTPIIFISIDTLRSDHLPAYGYTRVETPAISKLAEQGLVFERAYSHVPLTLPSHTSLLTGLLPAASGVRDNVGYLLDTRGVDAGRVPYLPHLLKKLGYQTGAGVSAFVLRGKTGLAHDFDFFEDSIEFVSGTGLGGLQRPGRQTLSLVEPWLEKAAGKPFFLLFHLYEPHSPYQPPSPFKERYPLAYDGEIASADQVVGQLLADLERLGLYDRALIALFSDHGEGLGDHGEDEHGVLLYREALQVPLILRLPRAQGAGTRVKAPAQLTDLAPTVLRLLGQPQPPAMKGTSLLALAAGSAPERQIFSETFYPRLHFGWSDLASAIDSHHHYLEGPTPELFDLERDSAEQKNVLLEEKRAFADLRRALASYDRSFKPPGAVDPEARAALAALGYVGSVAGEAKEGPLPDPRGQLPFLRQLRGAFAFHAKGEYAEAAKAFRAVLAVNPTMVDALEYLGRALEQLGQREEALATYKKALALSQGAPHIALAAASLYLEMGDLKAAEEHARLALVAHPSFAHGVLSQIALARKDLDGAEREAREAMAAGENRIGPVVTLAAVLEARGRYEEVLELTAQAEATYRSREAQDKALLRGLYLTRGQALADLGRREEAEVALRKEIELFPQDPRAYSSLAILCALTGRPGEVPDLLRRMVETRPSAGNYAEAVKTLRILRDPASAQALLAHALKLYPGSPDLAALR